MILIHLGQFAMATSTAYGPVQHMATIQAGASRDQRYPVVDNVLVHTLSRLSTTENSIGSSGPALGIKRSVHKQNAPVLSRVSVRFRPLVSRLRRRDGARPRSPRVGPASATRPESAT